MDTVYFYGWVEDKPTAEVAKSLVSHASSKGKHILRFVDGFPSVVRGNGNIKKKAPKYLEMARQKNNVLIITDLDMIDCAPTLLRRWLKLKPRTVLELPNRFIFRVAVREVEAWLLADASALSKFLGIAKSNFPGKPDTLSDPKATLLTILRKKGTKSWHKQMLPDGNSASIGPLYNEKLCEFVSGYWDPSRASCVSPSLRRAIHALRSISENGLDE